MNENDAADKPNVSAVSNDDNAGDNVVKEEKKKKPRRIIRRRQRETKKPVVDPVLLERVVRESNLPVAYNFETHKCVERIYREKATHVALQMPEGLLMYATVLADVFRRLVPFLTEVSVLGDVTYGACCVDDLGSKAMGAQLLIHYGHSCLVPIQHTVLPCLYVFVEIAIDVQHLVDCVVATTTPKDSSDKPKIAVLGTIQFRQGVVVAAGMLRQDHSYDSLIPQVKPLSPGEVLGCTSPTIPPDCSVVVFVADGRFHLESCMIANPHVAQFLRYDPYSKTLTRESYAHDQMHQHRSVAIQQAKRGQTFGIVLGTLGRQGNPAVVTQIRRLLRQHGKQSFLMLLSEISPAKLALMPQIDVWVQVACPRLSIDWGHYFGTTDNPKPLLSPYEIHMAMNQDNPTTELKYHPMDFYSQDGGPWSNYHPDNKTRQCKSDCACDGE